MRNLLSKATVGAMIAGAALTVAACSSETSVNTTNVTDLGNTTTMDANAMDMGMDANMTMDMNAMPPADMNMMPPADANMTGNGM